MKGPYLYYRVTSDETLTVLCCRKVTSLRDGHSTPPTDSLLRFLVESSGEEYPQCANCDRNEKSPMFFCNTCGEDITTILQCSAFSIIYRTV